MLPKISQKIITSLLKVQHYRLYLLPQSTIHVFLCKCQICKIPFRFLQKDGVSGVDIFMISLSFAVI